MPNKKRTNAILDHMMGLLIVTALLAATAIARDGKLFGRDAGDLLRQSPAKTKLSKPTERELMSLGVEKRKLREIEDGIWQTSSGEIIINSQLYASKVVGYTGNTPVYIALKNDTIAGITAASNRETPQYWNNIVSHGLLHQWDRKHISEALDVTPDVLSGATISSAALNKTVQTTLASISNMELKPAASPISWKSLSALLVLIFSSTISLLVRKKGWRRLQLSLNVLVLGLFCGSFLNMTLLIGWMSNGINLPASIATLAMLAIAAVMPFFNKPQFYCTNICPFGAAQELAGLASKRKISIPAPISKGLNYTRQALLGVILILMWTGVCSDLIGYELFNAFLFQSASPFLIIAAVIIILLSAIIPRPYCRFVCPTGTLLKYQEKI